MHTANATNQNLHGSGSNVILDFPLMLLYIIVIKQYNYFPLFTINTQLQHIPSIQVQYIWISNKNVVFLTTGIFWNFEGWRGKFFTLKTGIPGGPGLVPGHIVLDGDPVGTQPLPTFRPMSIVAKRWPISATAELLLLLPRLCKRLANMYRNSCTRLRNYTIRASLAYLSKL